MKKHLNRLIGEDIVTAQLVKEDTMDFDSFCENVANGTAVSLHVFVCLEIGSMKNVSEVLDGNLAAPGQFGGIPFADEGDKLVKKAVLGLMLRYILLGKVAIFDIVGDEIKCNMDKGASGSGSLTLAL